METITLQSNIRVDEKIAEIIDSVLTQVFGKEATKLIYRHLERKYSLKRGEFCEKIDVFAKGLKDFLNSGAYVVEQKILRDISSNYGSIKRLEPPKVQIDDDFVDQIKSFMLRA